MVKSGTVYKEQIMRYKDGPRAERVKFYEHHDVLQIYSLSFSESMNLCLQRIILNILKQH